MKKTLIMLAIAGTSITSVCAQNSSDFNKTSDKYQVLTNRFKDNWFISVGGGASMLMGNQDVKGSFGDRISPTLNVGVGKWFTPGLGLRLQYSGLKAYGYTPDASNEYVRYQSESMYKQKISYGNLHGDVLFNLNSLFGGYNPDRVYEIIPYVGAGLTHTYSGDKTQAFAVNAGIINRFRLGNALDLNLELSAMGVENKFDKEVGGKKDFDGVVSATLGLTYKFKARGFKKPQAQRQLISEAELANIRSKMGSLASENAKLKQDLAAKPTTVIKEVEKESGVPQIAPRSVFFNIGSSTVSQQELVNLGFLADQMKEFPNLKFKLVGYADAATGTAEKNKALSLKRAQAVVDALATTYGIERSRMTVDAAGGIDKFAKDKVYLNRMVQIEVAK
ncbi:OmpA family protein [Bacteroides sp. 224]|uniref:OmpA family protein n=1 Tax=Bacteroides sp. 224 TaxID=2302936 RepID=UPI0013D3772A|nr:OmpA family protein [Bacteroides sp. 224]NDV66123.1 OmpA family protein [Bacteroides sp. 224]